MAKRINGTFYLVARGVEMFLVFASSSAVRILKRYERLTLIYSATSRIFQPFLDFCDVTYSPLANDFKAIIDWLSRKL